MTKCVDCGKQHMRCPDCQKKYKKNHSRNRYLKQKEERKHLYEETHHGAIINGHEQICKVMGSCFYGNSGKDGCAYALEMGKTRLSQGLYIVDGKCPAYKRKKKGESPNRIKPATMFGFANKQMAIEGWNQRCDEREVLDGKS